MNRWGRPLSRRHMLGMGVATAALVVAGCSADEPPSARTTTAGQPTHRPTSAGPSPSGVAPSATAGGPAVQAARGGSGRPQVALTFHGAGDLTITDRSTTRSCAAGAKATSWRSAPGWPAARTASGCSTTPATTRQPHLEPPGVMAGMSADTTLSEIERCRDKLTELLGTPGSFFRQSSAPNRHRAGTRGGGHRRVSPGAVL